MTREYFVKFKVLRGQGEVTEGTYVRADNADEAIEEARPANWNGCIFVDIGSTLVDIVCLGEYRE